MLFIARRGDTQRSMLSLLLEMLLVISYSIDRHIEIPPISSISRDTTSSSSGDQ
jgi:hypothetical protein